MFQITRAAGPPRTAGRGRRRRAGVNVDHTVLSAIEGVRRYPTGEITLQQLGAIECASALTVGACPGQLTANTMGYYTTEVGELSHVVHMWQYRDMADREGRRAALEADPRWLAYRSKSSTLGHGVQQQNSLLKAVDFGAFGLADVGSANGASHAPNP